MRNLHSRDIGFPCVRPCTQVGRGRCTRETRLHALLGIDLGTTNSSVAIIGEDGPRIVPDVEGRTSVPSEVLISLVQSHVRDWHTECMA